MNDDKERIVIINNIKGLFEEGRVIGSVVDIDESCKPAVEVYYLPKSFVDILNGYKEDIVDAFVKIIMSKTISDLESNIKLIIMIYYVVLKIKGYSKKLLTDYLFDAINEPHDIYQGMNVLINDIFNEELIEEFETKMENIEFYYEIYKEMVVLLLPMIRGFSARTNVIYNLEKMLSNKLNIK